jgi:hypothetical protein
MPFTFAQLAILHILFCFGVHPLIPFGQVWCVIRGHFSQAIPQTPIFIFYHRINYKESLICI